MRASPSTRRRRAVFGVALCLCAFVAACGESGDPRDKSVKEIGGKHYDADGIPTYKIAGGAVDWYTFSGYVRFTATCLVCHGPDAAGSTFAPALANSLDRLSYAEFVATVAHGRRTAANVMPPFVQNKAVMCALDNIYVYLRARAHGAIPRGKPEKHAAKLLAAAKAEEECFGAAPHRLQSAQDED
jgi:methanol metabolism-related c-type cytochrome